MKKWSIIFCFLGIGMVAFIGGLFYINKSKDRRSIEEKEPIDTGIVRVFTDERFEEQNPGIVLTETILGMGTNRTDIFLVEYWWKVENRQQHYGYQVWSDGEQCQILQEGKGVSKSVMMENSLINQPLEFFDCSFHDAGSFTFDGFRLTMGYAMLKERMELTETAIEPDRREEKSTDGWEQSVTFSQVSVADYPETIGEVTYHFYEGQFVNGTMEIEFPDYKSALQYAKEKAKVLLPLQKETVKEEQEKEEYKGFKIGEFENENSYMVQSVDERGAYIQIKANVDTRKKGIVTVFFQENKIDMIKDSAYFDFENRGVGTELWNYYGML